MGSKQNKRFKFMRVLDTITGKNESKILTKHISYQCKCRFNGRKNNSDQS